MSKQYFLVILFYLGSLTLNGSSGLKLVINTDCAADAAIAITTSILYEKHFNGPEIVALTTSYGNANLSQAVFNCARILKLCNRSDIPMYAGARKAIIKGMPSDNYFGKDALGDDGTLTRGTVTVQKAHAAVGLIELSKKHKGDLLVMSIGPMTNIALAISLDPGFIGRLSQLYIGAGHIHSHAHPGPQFNTALDPEAYSIVTNSANADSVTIVPSSQVSDSLKITKTWRTKVLGAINTPIMKALNGYERIPLSKTDVKSWILLEPAVAVILLDSCIVKQWKTSRNGVMLCGAQRGIITNNFTSKEPNVLLVMSASVETYKKRLVEIYSAELSETTVS